MFNYSYLKASIGSSSAALEAGKYPKIIPIILDTPTESTTDHKLTAVSQSEKDVTPKV